LEGKWVEWRDEVQGKIRIQLANIRTLELAAPNDLTGGTSLIDGYSGVEYLPNFKRLFTRYQYMAFHI